MKTSPSDRAAEPTPTNPQKMKKLKYTACQRVSFTAMDTIRIGVIECAIGGNGLEGDLECDDSYDITDTNGRLFCNVPEAQVHAIAASTGEYDKNDAMLTDAIKGGAK